MKMGECDFLLLLIVAVATSATRVVADEPDWTTRVAPYNGIYPSPLELSQARRKETRVDEEHTLGGGSGLIAVSVKSARADEH